MKWRAVINMLANISNNTPNFGEQEATIEGASMINEHASLVIVGMGASHEGGLHMIGSPNRDKDGHFLYCWNPGTKSNVPARLVPIIKPESKEEEWWDWSI